MTFFEDTASISILDGHLWRLAEQVSDRAKARELAGRVVTLKLKRANHSNHQPPDIVAGCHTDGGSDLSGLS